MPESRSATPVGKARCWVERCLLFLDRDIQDYAFHLHKRGYNLADILAFRKGMTAFFSGSRLNDNAFCLCLELSGAMAAWFADNEQIADEDHAELMSFMFDCLMDGQVTLGAIANARSTHTRLSAF